MHMWSIDLHKELCSMIKNIVKFIDKVLLHN